MVSRWKLFPDAVLFCLVCVHHAPPATPCKPLALRTAASGARPLHTFRAAIVGQTADVHERINEVCMEVGVQFVEGFTGQGPCSGGGDPFVTGTVWTVWTPASLLRLQAFCGVSAIP